MRGLLVSLIAGLGSGAPVLAAAPIPPARDFTGMWQAELCCTLTGYDSPERPPYRPAWARRYARTVALARGGKVVGDFTVDCTPPGLTRLIVAPYPLEIAERADALFLFYEYQAQSRRVPIAPREPPPVGARRYNGWSVAHWSGDTLVIETTGFREDTVLDRTGLAHGPRLKVIERLRKDGPDRLALGLTLIDPDAFTRPWRLPDKVLRRRSDLRIMDYSCRENPAPFSRDADGVTRIRLAGERPAGGR
jgi:hypothetical protein